MADMVVAAGIDAAGHVDVQLADVFLVSRVREHLLHGQRHGDRARIGKVAIVESRADDHVGDPALVGGAESGRIKRGIDRRQVIQRDMRQDQVLGMADADISVPVLFGQIGHDIHLGAGGIPRRRADRFQADGHCDKACHLVRMQVHPRPAREGGIGGFRGFQRLRDGRLRREVRRCEIGMDARHFRSRQVDLLARALRRKLFLNLADIFRLAELRDQDLDARLVLVVAPAIPVVDAHDRLEIVEDLRFGHERIHQRRNMRRAPLPAADMHFEAHLSVLPADMQPHIVDADRGPVMLGRRHRNLELARQESEFRMERRPLPDDLAPCARIEYLVLRGAGKMIRGCIADTVAGGLDGMHLNFGELLQNVRYVLQRHPVELDILARREVSEAPVIIARDLGEAPELHRRELAIRNRDAQHVGVQLQVYAVLQPQRLELVLQQFAGQTPSHLPAKLRNALAHYARVKLVISVHAAPHARAADQAQARNGRPRHAPPGNHRDRTRLHARAACRRAAQCRRASTPHRPR